MSRWISLLLTVFLLAFGAPACLESDTGSDTQDAMAASGKFELFLDDDGKHNFQLLARNGQVVLSSNAYATRSSAVNGVKSVQANGPIASRYDVLQADNGEFYFNLKASNGRVIATSETYVSRANAERGVSAVQRALESAVLGDAAQGAVRFELQKTEDNRHTFHLRARNGQILLRSNAGYSSKSAAEGGVNAVKRNAVDAARFRFTEGEDGGQHSFQIVATNGQIVGRGKVYASKSSALRGAARVRELIREMTGVGDPSDTDLEAEINQAASGLWYMSESDFPFTYVHASVQGAPQLDEALVRELFAGAVDGDPNADGPMTELYGMTRSWDSWKDAGHSCHDAEYDDESLAQCNKMRTLEAVLEANLEGIQVFYFGSVGGPGDVDGIGVSVFIVGWTKEGSIAGVRTIAIWT